VSLSLLGLDTGALRGDGQKAPPAWGRREERAELGLGQVGAGKRNKVPAKRVVLAMERDGVSVGGHEATAWGCAGLVTEGGVGGGRRQAAGVQRALHEKVGAFACDDPFAQSRQPESSQASSLLRAETRQPPCPVPRCGCHGVGLVPQGPCPHPCSASRLVLQRQLPRGFCGVQQSLTLPMGVTMIFPLPPRCWMFLAPAF